MTRRGFTLVEILVALVVMSLVALVAHGIFRAGADTARSLAQTRRGLDHDGNARRLLSAALLSLDIGVAGQPLFEGYADRVRFAAWMETPEGWFEPVPVEVWCENQMLVATLGGQRPVVLADSVTAVRFDYLLEPGAGEAWITEWVSSLSAPIGLRLRVYQVVAGGAVVGDTTLLQIKARK